MTTQQNRRFRWPVTVEKKIPASSQAVWEAISMPGNLELCHPFCSSNPVQVWPGPDSLDEIHYLSGWVYERQFTQWLDGIGYDLKIGRKGGEMSSVSWRILPVDDQNSILRLSVCSHALQNLPAVIRWAPFWFRLRPMLKSYLESVVGGFHWYLTRGEKVPRNKFGRHPWFSASETSAEQAS